MRKIHSIAVLAAALAAAQAHAQAIPLRHTQSVYADEKGAALRSPEGVACRGGVAVVADTGNKRILRFAVKGGSLSGGTEVKLAQVPSPSRVQLDAKGNALVLDLKTRRIARLDPKGAFAGWIEPKATGGRDVTVASFKLDASDNLWVLDGAGRRVLALDAAGAVTREVKLPATGVITDFTVEAGGKLYAVDGSTATVWSAEPGAAAFQPFSKSLKEYMNFPAYITSHRGKLLLVDQYGHGLVVVNMDGAYAGRQLSMGWGDGLVYYPAQLCVGADGELLLADRYNNRVQVFALAQ